VDPATRKAYCALLITCVNLYEALDSSGQHAAGHTPKVPKRRSGV
jgi:hypothetical protein